MDEAAGVRHHTWGGEPAVTVAGAELAATFLPDLGLLGVSLRHLGDELLALPGGLDAWRERSLTGLPIMAPWANRLASHHYEAAGQRVDVDPAMTLADDNGLPLHGTLTARPGWVVDPPGNSPAASDGDDSSGDGDGDGPSGSPGTRAGGRGHGRVAGGAPTERPALRATFDHSQDPELLAAFPFPHVLAVTATVDGCSLEVATTLRVVGPRPVPVSFGWHPFFRLPGVERSRWRLELPDREHHLLGDDCLPTGQVVPEPAEAAPIGGRTFDDLYGLTGERRLALVGGGRRLTLALDGGYPYAQVWVPPGADFACLEAMTAPIAGLSHGQCPLVEPGGTFTASFTLHAARLD